MRHRRLTTDCQLKLLFRLLLLVQCLRNLIAEASFVNDLLDQQLIAVLKVILGLGPANRPR